MSEQLPTPQSEGTPTAPPETPTPAPDGPAPIAVPHHTAVVLCGDELPKDLPRLVPSTIRALAPGWRWKIVYGLGNHMVREKIATARDEGLRNITGKVASTRTTADVERPIESVTLRVQHADGDQAYASWTRPIRPDEPYKAGEGWKGGDAAVMPAGEAPRPIGWITFRAAVSWVDDEPAAPAAPAELDALAEQAAADERALADELAQRADGSEAAA